MFVGVLGPYIFTILCQQFQLLLELFSQEVIRG